MELFSLRHSDLHKDGRHIGLAFETDGEPLSVEVNMSALETIMSALTPVVQKAREIRGGSSPTPARPAGAAAKAMQDHPLVWLAFRMPNGLDHAFALTAQESADLRVKLLAAEKNCKTA